MRIEVKGLFSLYLERPNMPPEPDNCAISLRADIGLSGSDGAEQFNFVVVTPSYLASHPTTRWGRGYLLIPEFSWSETERMLQRLISSVSAKSWPEAAKILNNYLEWEFDNYQPYNEDR